MAISLDKLETVDAWSEALDYKIDLHLQLLNTKDPVKRNKLEALYKKAERVCDRLAKQIYEPETSTSN